MNDTLKFYNSSDRSIVGVDIGGANLKYADCRGKSLARCFPMWRACDELANRLADDLQQFPAVDAIAVTMTGELADCFRDRELGVRHIIQHTQQAADSVSIPHVWFYGVDGQFHSAAQAREQVDLIAAANWHALANFVGANIINEGLLIDVGSTTTDIIPICGSRVATKSTTDFERLVEGSLVYVGCRRTPVCALVDELEFEGRAAPVMNELFATIDDARLLLGHQAESSEDTDSADGQPRTKEFAANRLARMIGLDRRQVGLDQARKLAIQVVDAATHQIHSAVEPMLSNLSQVVISGHGSDLIQLPSCAKTILLPDQLGAECSRAAPAFAVARLCDALQRVTES